MGTIQRRGTAWRAQVARHGARASKTFPTRQEAADWIVAREAAILAGEGATGRQTLAQAVRRHMEGADRPKADRLRLARLAALPWASEPLRDLTPETIARWRDARLKAAKPGTVIREMTTLRSLLEVARREWRWIDRNPIADVRRPPAPQPRRSVISDADRDAIVAALGFDGVRVETIRHEAAVALLLALETAMRAGELLALTEADVDLKRRVAVVRRSKTGPGRDVPLSHRAVALFKVLAAKRLVRVRSVRDGRLWHIDSASLDTTFRRARRAAGVEGVTFHDARATALTRLSRILSPLELARMAGHSNLGSLMIYYRESAEAIAERLG
jgi:integrase